MIKGLYTAASAMVNGVNRQELLSHNVSNMDTPGFKQILSTMEDFTDTSVYTTGNSSGFASIKYLGNLGLGVETSDVTTDFSQGSLETTSSATDFAIQGAGFFRVETPTGDRYTRDGRFGRDTEGNLVTVDGNYVLDQNGNRIQVPDGELVSGPDGTLTVGDQVVGQIGLFAFKDPAAELVRAGDNTYIASGQPTGENPGKIEQYCLEMSNADATTLMTQLVTISRSYQAAQQMVQNEDELLGKAISSLGRTR